jgi:multiple sugar transport system substrate-binding protein
MSTRPSAGTRGWTRRAGLRASGALAGGGAGAALAACAAPGGGAPPTPTARDVTVSYVTDWAGPPRGDYLAAAVPRFQEEHPHIKVRVDNWAGEVTAVAAANAAAGTLQDTMLNSNDVFITLVRGGGWKDIAPVLKSQNVKMDDLVYLPSTISYQGKRYGMPFQMGPLMMLVNKTLFKTAGAPLPTDRWTYPDMLEALRKVARPADNVHGFLIGAGSPGAWGQWLPFVWGYGGDRWTPDLKSTLLDQPGAMEGLQFFVDLMYRHQVAAPLDAKGAPAQGVGFNNGNVAVAFATAPAAGLDRTLAGKFEWDLMYHPLGPKTGKRAVFVNDQGNMVTAAAAERGVWEQAAQFVIWLSASKTAQELVVDVGPNAMPVLKSVESGAKYLAGPPAGMKAYPDEAPSFRDPQIFIGWNQWRDDVVAALTPAFANQKSVQDAAKDATRAGDLVLAKIPK